ncbi:MAG TPA: thioredoxin domain-containing protein [archaeon]|nr:thioredoxin domain-containing protein [archaeon]
MNTEPAIERKNRLSNEKSPYLLQHANNPVDWYPWGDEAFEMARKEEKPIFLSIGYSTCHWCHVMAHESFEDNEVAELINNAFIPIKVDREERPDIDKIYMTVCQMMTGSGGWPLTIFMTPEKQPFFAGTYFPKNSRFGRLGLVELINRVEGLWNNQRNELLNSANQIVFNIQNLDQESPGEKFKESVIETAYQQLNKQFDIKNGGFGTKPKFPTPHNLILLLRFWNRTGNTKALEIVEKTLVSMRNGGIYDQIGFGFHRYSTDSMWLVPHFEKMLYDQALLAMAYTEAYQITKKILYKETAKEIFTYVLRDMLSPEGGFFSAEDADSEGEEGKFYIWSMKELKVILDKEELELFRSKFKIQDSGNYIDEATQKKTGYNILYREKFPDEDLRDKYELIRKKLFEHRKNRISPYKDKKILTDWNGLMIAALTRGATVFQEEKYLQAAKKAVHFAFSNLRKSDNRLLHRYKDGFSEINGFLSDYTFLIWGLIELYEATFDLYYLKTAITLNEAQIAHFWDKEIGGFYFNADDSEELLIRPKDIYDGAIPSGNSIAMLNMLRLSYFTGNAELEKKACILNRVFSEKIRTNPLAHTQFLIAIDFAIGPSYSIVIGGDSKAEDTNKLISAINSAYVPNKVIIQRKTEQKSPEIDEISNFVQYFDKLDGKATAYVCINKMCKPPTNDRNTIIQYLNASWDSSS